MKNVIKFTIGIIISAVFLYLALKGIAWKQVKESLSTGSYLYLIPAIAIHFVSFYLRSVKWSLITSKIKEIDSKELFPIITIGLAMNNILPLRAGEFGRIVILSKKLGISAVDAGISIVIERIFDIIGLIGIVFIFIRLHPWPTLVGTLLNTASIFILAFFIFTPLILYSVKSLLENKILDKFTNIPFVSKVVKQVINAKETYFKFHDIKLVVLLTLMSLLLWTLEGFSYYILSFVFGIHISLLDFIFLCGVVNLSSALPSSPGFIGTFEFFTTTLLVFLGIPKALALSYTLILHIELLLPVTLVGMYFYFVKRYDSYVTLSSAIESHEE